MTKRASLLQRLRAGGLLLALFALTFKALLPPGYMLSEAQGARIAITLCGGLEASFDVRTGETRLHDKPGEAPRDHNAEQPCAFALIGAPVVAPQAAALAPARRAILLTPPATRFAAAYPSVAGPPLPARGPPLQA